MIVGVPKEIKNNEYRVGLLPVHCETLVQNGHRVLVQQSAGEGSGAPAAEYKAAGAQLLREPAMLWRRADLIVKVKEPQPAEIALLRPGQTIFTYFHFAADRALFEGVLRSGSIAVAYETIQLPGGSLPLLTPMSEVAGRMAVHQGAKCLEEPMKGRGLLLGGVPGVAPAKVVVLGGGVVGANAAKMAAGLGADVTILDVNLDRLRYLDDIMPPNVKQLMSNPHNIRQQIRQADLLIGAVLVPGARAPKLVTEDLVKQMKRGAVIVDVAIDQGGCIETSRPTTHANPTFVVHGVVHYCVTNMPGAVAHTSTAALTNATFPYVAQLAAQGVARAARENPAIAAGVNIANGHVTHAQLAKLFQQPFVPLTDAL